MNFQALLFDMDGVIVDTERIHHKARLLTYKKYDIDYNKIKDIPVAGRNTDSIFKDISEKIKFPVPLKEAISEKRNIFVSLLTKPIPILPGIKDFLNKYSNLYKTALVTSSCRKNVNAVIKNTKIDKYFNHIVLAEDVTKFKPSPEGYLLAAKKLDVNPKNCIVFEDSQAGIRAGKAAQSFVVGIKTGYKNEDFSKADIVIPDLKKGYKTIENLLEKGLE